MAEEGQYVGLQSCRFPTGCWPTAGLWGVTLGLVPGPWAAWPDGQPSFTRMHVEPESSVCVYPHLLLALSLSSGMEIPWYP